MKRAMAVGALVLSVACRPGSPTVDDEGDDHGADLPSDSCGDGTQDPAELCLKQSTLEVPALGLQVGDINADGNLDLIHFSGDGAGIELAPWRGDGAGGFTSMDPVSHPGAKILQYLAELDGNPGTDVLTIGADGQLAAFINDGVGGFSGAVVSAPDPSAPWQFPLVADFNLDGRTDILAQSLAGPGAYHVLANAGDGSFAATGETAPSDQGCFYTRHATIPEFSEFAGGLMIVNGECGANDPQDRHLTMTWTTTDGQFVAGLGPDPGDSPGAMVVGKFAVEDTPDALLWDTDAATFRHYRSEFTGGFEFMGELSWTTLCPDCGAPPSVVRLWTGHMDSGGVADLIIGTNDYLVVALNPLSESPRWETFSTRAIRAIVADFNNDGLDDLVVEVATNEPCILLLSDP